MLKKITLVTLFISCGALSAELITHDKAVSTKLAPVKIQAISLEKIHSFKCTPFPLCADYPEEQPRRTGKTATNTTVPVVKPK